MFRFFKTIRQKLVPFKGVQKYSLYAIGEIILVMIGILLALQVNNWNENRKSRQLEIGIYKEIKDDLSASLQDIENGIESHIDNLNQTVKLRDHLKSKELLNDSIVRYLINTNDDDQFFPKTTGFEGLKSVGLKTLTNDTLRQEITNLYQLGFVRVVGMGRDKAPVRNFEFMTTFIDKYVRLSDEFRKVESDISEGDSLIIFRREINNYDQLLNDDLLVLKLQEAISIRRFKLENYHRTAGWTRELEIAIDEELARLEN
ncbi:MAG: hypothetical protein DA407_11975 [Bacteroidetes bacterium]|nr:MAG: hypothetical protein DA407_11975 [Bacteroidota bacterium]